MMAEPQLEIAEVTVHAFFRRPLQSIPRLGKEATSVEEIEALA